MDRFIPIYNGARDLPALLAALGAQTYPADRTEFLLVDNNSDDETRAILDVCPDRRLRVLACARQGQNRARNLGVAEAHGEILAFTDADCRPASTWLEAGLAHLHRAGLARLAGEVRIPARWGASVWELLDASFYLDQDLAAQQGWGATANLFVHRAAFAQVGTFHETLLSWSDVEFGARCTAAGLPIAFGPEAVVTHPPRRDVPSLLRRSRRHGVGMAQVRHERLPTYVQSWRSLLRRPFSSRLEASRFERPPLSAGERCLLQALRFALLAPAQSAGYLWARRQLRRASVEPALSAMARSERRSRPR